ESFWPLNRNLGISLACELHISINSIVSTYVSEVAFLVGGIHANEEIILGNFMNKDVVRKPAVVVEKPRIVDLARFEAAGIVGRNIVDQLGCLGTGYLDFAHMTDVKKANRFSNRVMFLKNPRILNGHFPAAKVNHPRAAGLVDRK